MAARGAKSMKIAKVVQENLESQLVEYEKLLNLAKEKSVFLSQVEKRDPQSLQRLVQKEVTVVSSLQDLESKRKKLCSQRRFDDIVHEAGEHQEPLLQLKGRLKSVAQELGKINDKNKLALGVSIKIVRKVIQAVKDLAFPEEVTYSRIQKGSKVHTYNSVNLTA